MKWIFQHRDGIGSLVHDERYYVIPLDGQFHMKADRYEWCGKRSVFLRDAKEYPVFFAFCWVPETDLMKDAVRSNARQVTQRIKAIVKGTAQ